MSELEYGSVVPEYDEDGNLIEYYAVRPNKSQIKRDIAEIAKLAEMLTHITDQQLATMDMPEQILLAITAAKKMSDTKPARKRQMKFITAQLRTIDLTHITETLERMQSKNAHGVREHHQAEKWRDRLLSDDNQALTELLDQFPNTDSQHIRQLQRNAQKELSETKPPKSARLLYQYLKTLVTDAI